MAKIKTEQKKTSKREPKKVSAVPAPTKKAIAKSNPRRPAKAVQPATQSPIVKQYYTVGEDAVIIRALNGLKKDQTKTSVVKDLVQKLNKTEESIRNRIKRYIRRLTPADQLQLLKVADKNPDQYLHLKKGGDGYRKIDHFDAGAPSIINLGKFGQKTKKTVKPAQVKKSNNQEDITWLQGKIQNADPYFQLENQVYLINALLQILVERKTITVEQRNSFINEANGKMSLSQVLNLLKAN